MLILPKRVFAIGNGESRKSIDLNELRPHGITYGCNALYRDFQPDALVCVDPRMKSEVWLTDYLMENKGYFKEWTNTVPISSYPDTEILPSQPGVLDSPKKVINSDEIIKKRFLDDAPHRMGYASGPSSVLIACIEEEPEEVYLIGHDMFSTTKYFNNVYKGTRNYLGSETDPCPPNNWITQLKSCFNDFGSVQFYMVNPLKEKIDDWDGVANIHYITIDEMWKRLNR